MEPIETNANLRAALLHEKPLWRDILACCRQGFSETATARICGCKLTTLRKHLLRMAILGFNTGEAQS